MRQRDLLPIAALPWLLGHRFNPNLRVSSTRRQVRRKLRKSHTAQCCIDGLDALNKVLVKTCVFNGCGTATSKYLVALKFCLPRERSLCVAAHRRCIVPVIYLSPRWCRTRPRLLACSRVASNWLRYF